MFALYLVEQQHSIQQEEPITGLLASKPELACWQHLISLPPGRLYQL
jgi:hypothetical protein